MYYEANRKACNTSKVLKNKVNTLDQKKDHKDCKILLLIYFYSVFYSANISWLKPVKIEFMPPNTTPKIQPLDQGIVQNFKVKYWHEVIKKCIT